jgi:hypothetical protein
MCNYPVTLFLYILKYFVRSSDVLMLRKYIYIYIYIPLLTFNSGELVTLRGKIQKKFHLRLFVKGGALQQHIFLIIDFTHILHDNLEINLVTMENIIVKILNKNLKHVLLHF